MPQRLAPLELEVLFSIAIYRKELVFHTPGPTFYIVNHVINYGIPGTKAPEITVRCLNRRKVLPTSVVLMCFGNAKEVTKARKVLALIIEAVWELCLIGRKHKTCRCDDHNAESCL